MHRNQPAPPLSAVARRLPSVLLTLLCAGLLLLTLRVSAAPAATAADYQSYLPIVTSAPGPRYRTAPADLPQLTVNVPASGTAPGYIFLLNFTIDWATGDTSHAAPYLLIVDNAGEPVFYRALGVWNWNLDFKPHANGLLSYFASFEDGFAVLNNRYELQRYISAGNGFTTDPHDLQFLPNGNAALMIYDYQTVDMRAWGGPADATVIGLVLQEVTPAGEVVFEWQSWDHIPFEDSFADLTAAQVDYVHGNSIEIDHDGHWIISSRALSEVTKIDRQTGAIIWRLGGKQNQFTFDPADGEPFLQQHDARRLPNGNLTLFDNRGGDRYARYVEYALDEVAMTATRVREFRQPARGASLAMGNAQRLPNGNTLIGWGSMYPSVSEVTPDGRVALELSFERYAQPTLVHNSYRALRAEWVGAPPWPPALVVERGALTGVQLYTSWNGATEVAGYRAYAARTPDGPWRWIASAPKTGFETLIPIANPGRNCYFQTAPFDAAGNLLQRSPVVAACP